MRIACISDLHFNLPKVSDCDILIIAGDLALGCNTSSHKSWYLDNLKKWMENLTELYNVKKIVGVAGNHDFLFQEDINAIKQINLPWNYLEDNYVIINDIKIYGSPWQPYHGGWAFNTNKFDYEELGLEEIFSKIPNDVDILITHSPPKGIIDYGLGSISLKSRIKGLSKLKLHVFGHIHPPDIKSKRIEEINGKIFVNASLVNIKREFIFDPIYIEI